MTKTETKAETKVDSSKGKAVELAVTQIERQYGKGAIMRMGAEAMLGEIPVLSTGSLSLNLALGVGGVVGRFAGVMPIAVAVRGVGSLQLTQRSRAGPRHTDASAPGARTMSPSADA